MSSIDDLKNKLNVDNLDKSLRNEMFNKFVDKGGQVIKDKKSKVIKFDRSKQQFMKDKLEKNKQNNREKYDKSNTSSNNNSSSGGTTKKNKQQVKKKYLIVFIRGLFQGVFTFSENFNKKFSESMYDFFSKSINELYQITSQILALEPEKRWNAIDIINTNNPLGYEIVVRINKIYKKDSIDKLNQYFKYPQKYICHQIIPDLFRIFKDILILSPYWETSKQILWECQQLYQDITSLPPLFQRSKINKDIDKLFSYIFPRLLTIINYNTGNKVTFVQQGMYDFAKISTDSDMGIITKKIADDRKEYLVQKQKEKDDKMKKLKEDIEKKESEKIPKFVQRGLSIIESITVNIPQLLFKDNTAAVFEENEKMLEFYFIFKEFDEKYSFIMTTSQIKFEPKLEAGVRTDIKADMERIYIKFNEILSYVKEYIKMMEDYQKITDDLKSSPYALQQKVESINQKRIRSFFEIKSKAAAFFKKLSSILQLIVKDYQTEKRLVQNADDKLHFEITNEKNNKFQNIPIIKAVIYIFSFSSALHFYLTNGKIAEGGGLYFINKKDNDNFDAIPQDSNEDIDI